MVHTRTTIKQEQNESFQEKTRNIGQNDSDSDEEDWEEIGRQAQKTADEEDRLYLKNKKLKKSTSTSKHYTRRKNVRGSGIQINEPLSRAHSLPRESPWAEGQHAPSASTLRPSTSRRNTTEATVLSSIHQEQRRLSADQERLSIDLQQIAFEQQKMRKKCSKISRMLKGILSKLDCTSSDSTDLA